MDLIKLEWKLTHLIPMGWDESKKFQYGDFRLPTLKELKQAFENKFYGFESRFFWSSKEDDSFKDQAWFFDFKQGLPFRGDKRLNLYVRLCKETNGVKEC